MKHEIRDINEINEIIEFLRENLDLERINNLEPIRYDESFNYCLDIFRILTQLILEIQTGRSIEDVYLEINDINEKLNAFDEGIISEEYREKLDERYNRNFKYRNAESPLCIVDLFDWLSKTVSTEDFITIYLPIEDLSEKRRGNKPIDWERGIIVNMPLKTITEKEQNDLFCIIEKLSEIEKQIYDLKEIRNQIGHKEYLIRSIRLKNIALERNERGSRKYPNQSAIRAELALQLDGDPEYQKLIEQYAKIKEQEVSKIIEYNQYIDKKSVLMGILLENEKLKIHYGIPYLF